MSGLLRQWMELIALPQCYNPRGDCRKDGLNVYAWCSACCAQAALDGEHLVLPTECNEDDTSTKVRKHDNDCPNYLSAGDTPYASGDTAYTGCFLCGRPRSEHRR